MTNRRTPEPFVPGSGPMVPGGPRQPRRVQQEDLQRQGIIPVGETAPQKPGSMAGSAPMLAQLSDSLRQLAARHDELEHKFLKFGGREDFERRREALRIARRHVPYTVGLATDTRVRLQLEIARFLLGEREPGTR